MPDRTWGNQQCLFFERVKRLEKAGKKMHDVLQGAQGAFAKEQG